MIKWYHRNILAKDARLDHTVEHMTFKMKPNARLIVATAPRMNVQLSACSAALRVWYAAIFVISVIHEDMSARLTLRLLVTLGIGLVLYFIVRSRVNGDVEMEAVHIPS
jgi:O-antigen ligase